VGQERSSATTEATKRDMGWAFHSVSGCLHTNSFQRRAKGSDFMGQQINFGSSTSKHGPYRLRYHPRAPFTKIAQTSFNSPLATFPRATNPCPATPPPLSVASGRYCLLSTSGVHRPFGLCDDGRQSWTRPNDTQSATSNCPSTDQVTRRPHRQHLVHRRFVRALGYKVQSSTAMPRSELGTYFFRTWLGGRGQRGPRERALGPPTHPLLALAHRGARRAWRLAAQGGRKVSSKL
jgi:hypothetical protein